MEAFITILWNNAYQAFSIQIPQNIYLRENLFLYNDVLGFFVHFLLLVGSWLLSQNNNFLRVIEVFTSISFAIMMK